MRVFAVIIQLQHGDYQLVINPKRLSKAKSAFILINTSIFRHALTLQGLLIQTSYKKRMITKTKK